MEVGLEVWAVAPWSPDILSLALSLSLCSVEIRYLCAGIARVSLLARVCGHYGHRPQRVALGFV